MPKGSRWTAEMRQTCVRLAAEGKTMKQAAAEMGVGYDAVHYAATKWRIRFVRDMLGPVPERRRSPEQETEYQAARAVLRQKIEAIQRERNTAPLYRPKDDSV